MAAIRKRVGKKGLVRWYAEIMGGGQRKGCTFANKREALAWATANEDVLRSGGHFGESPAGDMLFSAATRRYEAEILPHKRPNTQDRERTILSHLDRFFGQLLLSEIDTARAAEYRNLRAVKVKRDTYLREFNVLSDLFNVAVREWRCRAVNPVKELKLPAKAPGRIRFLTELEARRLLEACAASQNEKLLAYVLQQLHTGMRPGEGAGIKWRAIDPARMAIELPETKTTPRWVPVTALVMSQIERLRPQSWRPEDYVYLPPTVSAAIRQRPNRYFRRAFQTACAVIDLKNFTMHDLRHTAASYLLMAGVDLRTIMEIIGHTTMQMLQKYTHLATEHKRAAVAKIGNLGR